VAWVDAHADLVEQEADRVTNKARKIGTTLRKIFPDLPRVDGAILLTQEPSKVKRLAGREVRGVRFSTLNDWKGALGVGSPPLLSRQQVPNLGRCRFGWLVEVCGPSLPGGRSGRARQIRRPAEAEH
jgi:hypothetical protein